MLLRPSLWPLLNLIVSCLSICEVVVVDYFIIQCKIRDVCCIVKLKTLALPLIGLSFSSLLVSCHVTEKAQQYTANPQAYAVLLEKDATDFTVPIYSQGTKQAGLNQLIYARHWDGLNLRNVIILEFSPKQVKTFTIAKTMSWNSKKRTWTIRDGKKYFLGKLNSTNLSAQEFQISLSPEQLSSSLPLKIPPLEKFVPQYTQRRRSDGSTEKVVSRIILARSENAQELFLQRVVIIDLEEAKPKEIRVTVAESADFDQSHKIWNFHEGFTYLFHDSKLATVVKFSNQQLQLPN